MPPPNFLLVTIATLTAYALGAIPSGVILARLIARKDVTQTGSGHTGALNALRAAGFGAGAFTLLADIAKAIVAIELARALTGSDAWAMALAGVAAVVGHILPIYTRGRGGMGLAPGIGALLIFAPFALGVSIALWFALKFLLKRSALASMGIALALTPILLLLRADAQVVTFGLGAGAVIFVRHWIELRRAQRSNE
jgi:glycerol-3-phosphate acyltransferase PlsY